MVGEIGQVRIFLPLRGQYLGFNICIGCFFPEERVQNSIFQEVDLDGLMNLSDRIEFFLVGHSCLRKCALGET